MDLMNFLNRFNKHVSQHILQGDFNLHSEEENKNYQANNLSDCWCLVHKIENEEQLSKNPGYTFDGSRNGMIQEMYWGF